VKNYYIDLKNIENRITVERQGCTILDYSQGRHYYQGPVGGYLQDRVDKSVNL